MKKLSKFIGIIAIAIALLIPTSVSKAYSGELDPDHLIWTPSMILNGEGTVTISNSVGDNYELYYEVLDLPVETGNRMTEIEDRLTEIDTEISEKSQEYRNKQQEGATEEELAQLEAQLNALSGEGNGLYDEYKGLIPDYVDTSWIKSVDNKFVIDLSNFSGERNFMVWFKLITGDGETVYSAVRSKQEGTKQEETAVKSVTLDKTVLTLSIGDTENLTATVLPETATDKSVKWTSDNEEIATVEEGKVTAKAEGTATITVETTDGAYKATCTVTVTKKEEANKEESNKEDENKKPTVLPQAGSSYFAITVAGIFVIAAIIKIRKYKNLKIK